MIYSADVATKLVHLKITEVYKKILGSTNIVYIFDFVADQEMKHECKTYNIENGPFLAGHVYVSKPRGLPYRFIIHAVCSRYRNGDHNEYEKLRQVIFSSLEEAAKLNITSILLPATYAELFNYPAGIAGDIILSTIGDCLNSSAVTSLKEVHIIDVDPAALFSFEKALKKLSDDVAATERPKKSRRGTVHADTASDNAGKQKLYNCDNAGRHKLIILK